ncbi:mTERF domain-containing mitochondrial [Chlorella sorokiniana]|uniref:mTERF domain-containing mitochondrial n=1 Tax=Chlorella sorokiniana TaxID=3076 RepID=A0A2P6TRN1_CHLSO|nr:mTERF domain-containing mitochondrial [Chlorella sorokiniana]|eukprot:PRW56726.1 mTERF domain-containing mitochondrial [Chlorella sorokiniana]
MAAAACRTLQQDHASLSAATRSQEQLRPRAAAPHRTLVPQRRRAGRAAAPAGCASGGRLRTAATAAAAAAAAPPAADSQQLGEELGLVGEQRPAWLNPALAQDDTNVVDFLFHQYKLNVRRQVRGKAERALVALQEAQPDAAHLSVERDILPKLELLEGLSPGLGWKVFRDYPEQFASPDAVECWRMLAAYLFTIGIEPDQITSLFTRHHVLFRHAVARPDALRRLFTWLQHDLDLPSASIMRLLHRCPTVLQLDVDEVLKPRLQLLLDLGLTVERAMKGVLRVPEVLRVSPGVLEAKVAYYTDELGLTKREVGAMYARDPSTLLISLPRIQEVATWLGDEAGLGLSPALRGKVVAKGGLLKYPLTTIQERVAYWQAHMGFSLPELHAVLDRLPRLLLYPVHERKYQDKLAFLRDELRLPQREVLLSFPAYLTYSLPGRIAPRAAASLAFKNSPLPLEKLAYGEAAFISWLKVDPGDYCEWEASWRKGAGARWAAAEGGSGGESAAAAASGEQAGGLQEEEEEL